MKKKTEKPIETQNSQIVTQDVIIEMSKGSYVLRIDTTTSRPYSSLESIIRRFPHATYTPDVSDEVIKDGEEAKS